MEYFAFGETFIEEHKNSHNSPYKYNGKELDEESGLYYYGARYYDPRISIWASVDPLALYNPIFEDEFYFDGQHNGGVYNSGNLAPFIYCYQNPIKYIDPNGKQNIPLAIAGGLIFGGIELGSQLLSGKDWGQVDLADVGIETLKGVTIGFNPALAGVAEKTAIALKASVDYSIESKGRKDVFGFTGQEKSVGEVAYDAGADIIGGKISDFGIKKVGQMAEGSVKKMVKAETKAVAELANATIKYAKATKGGTNTATNAAKRAITRLDVANSAATLARKNTVRSQMIKSAVRSPAGDVVKGGTQNTMTDKIKDFFGIGKD